MNEFHNLIKNYIGQPIYAVCLGGPGCFARFLTMPGSSRILSGIEYPYSIEAQGKISRHFLDPDYSSVSEQTTDILQKYIQDNYGTQVLPISCTAAMVTNRVRKGKERAYIGIGDYRYYLEFHRRDVNCLLPEELRIEQDYTLSFVMTNLILNPNYILEDTTIARSLEKIR